MCLSSVIARDRMPDGDLLSVDPSKMYTTKKQTATVLVAAGFERVVTGGRINGRYDMALKNLLKVSFPKAFKRTLPILSVLFMPAYWA